MSFPLLAELALASTVVVVGGVYFAYRALTKKHARSHLPPGPPPLPFIGNLHQMTTKDQVQSLRDMAKLYGVYTPSTTMRCSSPRP